MSYLALLHFGSDEMFANPAFGMWMFLSIGAVSLFVVFIPLVSWIDARRKEREAFYRADTMRRLAETSGEGAKAAMELMQQENRLARIKTREGLKIGGLITLAVGVSLTIFLGSEHDKAYLVGLIPALIGVAQLAYVFFFAAPLE